MKIAFNPSTVAALTSPPDNKDITFDLRGQNIFARGVKFQGTDTNTWRDIKINNVSIGSHTLDLRNGSNTTLTNTNGIVTINSTWRPVVDNLTSDSTTSSLSAKQGKVLKALIDGKSNSNHNHDGRYVRYYAVTTLDCNNLAVGLTAARISATNAAHTNHSAYLYISDVETPFQIQIPDSGIPYIYKRYYGSGKWSEWFKLNAGYADSAGSVSWANVTGKPSSYTPSAHTHAWNSLTHSSTTENQAILTNGKANGWKLQTLNIARWDNAANNAHSHANKSVLDGITSALVNSWNTAYNFVSNITGTDTDKVINKWEEIVNFLAGITEDNKLNTLLNSKLSIQQLSAKDILTTKTNNALFWVNNIGSASTITTGPFTDHPYALLSVTNFNLNSENSKYFYRSRLAFSSAGDIKVASCHHEQEYRQDETWYNVLTSKNSGINGSTIKLNGTSITVYSSGTADGRYVRAFGSSNDNIDSDWGQSFKTFDPISSGTPPEKNPNISLLSIGESFNRRKQLAFTWNNDNIYYRRRIDSGFTNWVRLALANEIPTSLKNPYALTISLNGTSQGPYDGSAAKNINITPGSIGAATSDHNHDGRYVRHYAGIRMDGASINKNALGMTTNSGITGDWWHILQAAWNGEYRWNSQIAFPTQNRNGMYYRSGLDDNTKWGSWVKLLDTNNYSSTLDSRYYTESEVNSLLSKKLDRVNLTTGSWNPRGYSLAADYFYNGGDLSISESGGQIHVSVDGYFWQNEGRYRVLDTSDVAELKGNLTVHQYLSATDAAWQPLVWGGNAHRNTSDSTGVVYKSYDKLCWQTSSQTLYATNIQTNNIKHLSIGGGIYWNPNVESASDGSDAASITLVRSGVAGGTTLVLSQMNDTNDTIQFKTNTAARLYHNNYPILTTQNTYVSNNKGYINGSEITQVNNSDKVDNRHAISTTPNTGIIYKAAIYTSSSLTSYWVRLASIPSISQNDDFVATIHVQSGHSNPGRSAILLVYLRGNASSFVSKSFKICCNSNYDPNRFRLYYKDSDKTSEIWYQTTGQWDGIITTVISQSSEGSLYEGLTLYSGRITAVQTPSMSTYLSAQVSTITDNISGNASTATKLATPRKIWGQSFDGTADVDNTLRIRKTTSNYCEGIRIQTGDGAWSTIILGATADSGTNTNAWSIHRKSDNNFAISRNSNNGLNGLVMTSVGMGLGTTSPTQRLDVNGNIRTTGNLYISHATNNNMNHDTSNPRIVFSESGNQAVGLVYTDYDSYRASKGLKVMDVDNNDPSNVWFEVQGYNYSMGYVKNGSNNNYVLLGGGGHKLESALNVANATNAYHLRINSANTWSTWYWAGQGGQPNWLWGSNDGTNMYVWNPSNFRVAYAASAGNAETLGGMPRNYDQAPFGTIPCIGSDGVMEIGRYIDYHYDNSGKYDFSTRLYATGNYGNEVNLPSTSGTLALTSDILNYYWANVKISASSSTTTSPTVHTLTATRVCAGHNPGIDNSISCSNWFRSSGTTGWYNTTYQGGWYMSDTSWIRALNGVGIYTSGQIYSSSSIRMGNILLEHTDEINNSANGSIHLNYRNSGNVSLCYGGGSVGIGTPTPSYKLDVNGQIRASGFHHASHNDDSYVLLAGGGTSHIKHGSTYWSTAIQFGNYVWLMLQISEASNGISVVPTNISNPTKDIYVMNAQLGRYDNSRHGRYRVAPNGVLYYVDGVDGMQIYTTICYVANS